jgi:hypothetical protein
MALLKNKWEEGREYNSHTEWKKLRIELNFSASQREWRHLIAGLRLKLNQGGVIRDNREEGSFTFVALPGCREKLLARATDPQGTQEIHRTPPAPPAAAAEPSGAAAVEEEIFTIYLPESKVLELLEGGHFKLKDILGGSRAWRGIKS